MYQATWRNTTDDQIIKNATLETSNLAKYFRENNIEKSDLQASKIFTGNKTLCIIVNIITKWLDLGSHYSYRNYIAYSLRSMKLL